MRRFLFTEIAARRRSIAALSLGVLVLLLVMAGSYTAYGGASRFDAAFGGQNQAALDPYERLIHDAMNGDRTLFTSSDAIERLWEISQPVLDDPPTAIPYEPGSWGPEEIDELIAPRRWHLPSDHI